MVSAAGRPLVRKIRPSCGVTLLLAADEALPGLIRELPDAFMCVRQVCSLAGGSKTMRRDHRSLAQLPWPLVLAGFSLLAGFIGFYDTLPRPYYSKLFTPLTVFAFPAAATGSPGGLEPPFTADALPRSLLETNPALIAKQETTVHADASPSLADDTFADSGPESTPVSTAALDAPDAAPAAAGPAAAGTSAPPLYALAPPLGEGSSSPQPREAMVEAASDAPGLTPPVIETISPTLAAPANSGPGKSADAPGHNKGPDGKPTKGAQQPAGH
jgi:hypothetical protein